MAPKDSCTESLYHETPTAPATTSQGVLHYTVFDVGGDAESGQFGNNIVPSAKQGLLTLGFITGRGGAYNETDRFVNVSGNEEMIGLGHSGYHTVDLPPYTCSNNEMADSGPFTSNFTSNATAWCPDVVVPTHPPTPAPATTTTPAPVQCPQCEAKRNFDCFNECGDRGDGPLSDVTNAECTDDCKCPLYPGDFDPGTNLDSCRVACVKAQFPGCEFDEHTTPTPAPNTFWEPKYNPATYIPPTPHPEWKTEWHTYGTSPTPVPANLPAGQPCELRITSEYWERVKKARPSEYGPWSCAKGLECSTHREGSPFSVISKSCQATVSEPHESLACVDGTNKIEAATSLTYIFVGITMQGFGAEVKIKTIRDALSSSDGATAGVIAATVKARIEEGKYDVDGTGKTDEFDAQFIYIGLAIPEDFGGYAIFKKSHLMAQRDSADRAKLLSARVVFEKVQLLAAPL
jgi:hypothetical protein